ncbi:MAG: iron-containing alcohol dehydrogenase [Prevotella sp.]|jgi:alcohol dehydrogenase YqhD (iron-dependent ADH family)
MTNFDYQTPTRLIFGKDVVNQLPEVMKPLGSKVLLTYGGGSIKRIGLYDRVKELLKDFEIYELPGIEPNPKYSPSVLDGVRICKEKGIDVILAVGGGSVLDCSKAIAAGAKYDGDPWDLITYKVPTKAALPIVDIMTLAATGSEYDCGGVISRTETNDKIGYMDRHLFPVASFLDPVYTFTVNAKHTAAGVADAINHVCEQYFALPGNDVIDGFCEGLIRTLMKYAPIAIKNPEDYEARAEIMFACTFGCNGILALGMGQSGWPMHGIEHALSAYYDITHGQGLAIIMPHWMRHVLCERTMPRFVKYGVNILGISPELPDKEIAEKAIEGMSNFFKSLGMPMTLREVGIDDSRLEEMAHHIATNEGLDNPNNFYPLSEKDILEILKAAL